MKPGPKGPSLNISQDKYEYRTRLLRYLSAARRQLLLAYGSGDRKRIATAKLRLSRILKEFTDTPGIGPTRPFKWGAQLEILIEAGVDEGLDSSMFNTKDWNWLANELNLQGLRGYMEADGYVSEVWETDRPPEPRAYNPTEVTLLLPASGGLQ